MLPSNLINIQYTSCIKIAGIPILPPLVTEERRKELQEDKEKAIAIENKLKAKRQSIDSGVMTGSYTEIFKNGELPLAETIPTHHPSILDQNPSSSSQTDTDSISGDSFLKSALEDQEFREFFYSTADRIFTDSISAASTTKNNNENTKDNIGFLVVTSKNNDEKIDCQNNEVKNTAEEKVSLSKKDSNHLLDLSVCRNFNLVSSVNNVLFKECEKVVCNQESPCVNEIPPTPSRMVRRNSYTLESPSPLLLEHMAKENEKTQNELKWQPLSDKKSDHTGFKTFTPASKPRKTWNKNPSPDFSLLRMNSRVDHSPHEHSKDNVTIDADDSISVCSSMSLTGFLPLESISSRPSTGEDIESRFTLLRLKHERQLAQLLEQQNKEKILLASQNSSDRSILSQTNTAMNVPYEESLQQPTFVQDGIKLCNKELFPQLISNYPNNVKGYNITEDTKAAAVKITAYAKGYLTRRLLRTERVQLCIEMIQESLRNALSLQNEQQLQKSELEFHERLAYQLTGSLSELQSIVSAPVAERMAIISADRERLKKPLSRPVSALSTATRKSLLRRQMSLTNVEHKRQESRPRTSLRSTKSDSFSKSNGINKSSSNTQNGKYAHGGNHQKK